MSNEDFTPAEETTETWQPEDFIEAATVYYSEWFAEAEEIAAVMAAVWRRPLALATEWVTMIDIEETMLLHMRQEEAFRSVAYAEQWVSNALDLELTIASATAAHGGRSGVTSSIDGPSLRDLPELTVEALLDRSFEGAIWVRQCIESVRRSTPALPFNAKQLFDAVAEVLFDEWTDFDNMNQVLWERVTIGFAPEVTDGKELLVFKF